MILTKTALIKWQSDEDANYTPISDQRDTKIFEMVSAEKTDGELYFIDQSTYARDFINQEAAKEFISFITELAATYDKIIISAEVIDK